MKYYPNRINHHRLQLLLSAILSLSICFSSYAQNLVPNPGFEIYTECPFTQGCEWTYYGSMPCPPWMCIEAVFYFNACDVSAFNVPSNFVGYQPAHGGDGYVGGYILHQQEGGRGFVQVQLLNPLDSGTCYNVSFFINRANNSCGMDQIGALFTDTAVSWPIIGMIPQIDWGGQFFNDPINWVNIHGSFIAVGGEEYLTLGNFYPNSECTYAPGCQLDPPYGFYYFDDVLVEETSPEPFVINLGGPYEECDSVVLETDVPDGNYTWSDGSHNPTYTVTQSGIYSVTVTLNCVEIEASTEVIIMGSPPVLLGPDITMCAGETYTIDLNESAGDYEWNDGSTEADYTISATGFYSVVFDDGCDLTSDEIFVEVIELPTPFSLGADTSLCPGETVLIEFDPSLGAFNWQDNSTSSTYVIDNAGIYSLTISNVCGTETDEIEVITFDPPVFNLGTDSTLLCEGEVINFNFDAGLGDFVWQDGSTNSNYTITGTGNYSLTVTNPCGTLSDQMHVNEISAPNVNLGGPIHLCQWDILVLNGENNYGEYTWQDGSSGPAFIVTTPGIYSLTVVNDCGFDVDSITVHAEPPVIPPNLGPDVRLCPGEQLEFEIIQLGTSILWSDFTTADTLIVSTAGTYFVNVFTTCESLSDTVVVTLEDNPPSLNLPPDFALCQGQSIILDAGVANVSYLWNDSTTQSQLAVTSSGIYALTVTNSCGSDMDTVLITDGGASPSVFLGLDTSICSGNSITLTPTFSNVNSWTWIDGSSTPFFVTSVQGIVFIVASNNCGTAYDTMMIDLLPAVPNLSLGSDTAICPGESITLSIAIPDVDILWPDGSVNPDFTLSDSAVVIASISNICGVSSDTMNLELLPDAPSLNLGLDQTSCPGETITISPDIPDVMYLWQDGSTDTEFQTTQEGIIILTISNSCGYAIDSLLITESTDGPQLNLGPDLLACEGESITIPAGISGVTYLWQDGSILDEYETTVSGIFILTVNNLCGTDSDTIEVVISGMPPITLLGPDTTLCEGTTLLLSADTDPMTSSTWQDGSALDNFEVSLTGTYYLTETNICGSDTDTMEVVISGIPPAPDLGQDTSLCEGATLLLVSNADPMTEVTWQNGSNGLTFLVATPGTYTLSEINHCGVAEDNIIVSFVQAPEPFELGPDTVLCPGESFLLSAPPTSFEIRWQDGSNLPFMLVDDSITYSLQLRNACGMSSDSLSVSMDVRSPLFELEGPLPWCDGDTISLDATQSFPVFYSWNTGEISPSILVFDPGHYIVEVEAPCVTASHEIAVEPELDCLPLPEFYVPNVFSPNGDNANDNFSIFPPSGFEYSTIEGNIFDRWGNLIFTSNETPFVWDGKFKRDLMSPGVYVFVVKVSFKVGNILYEKVFSGDVTLIK